MKNTEQLFDLLSRGGFISTDSVDPLQRRLYDQIEEDPEGYRDYFAGVGYLLEGGEGYWMFCRRETKVDLQRKLEAAVRWIDNLDFLRTFDPSFGPGTLFHASDILVRIAADVELKDKAARLYKGEKRSHQEAVQRLIKELVDAGYAELESVVDQRYKVTSALHYLESLLECVEIAEEVTGDAMSQ